MDKVREAVEDKLNFAAGFRYGFDCKWKPMTSEQAWMVYLSTLKKEDP